MMDDRDQDELAHSDFDIKAVFRFSTGKLVLASLLFQVYQYHSAVWKWAPTFNSFDSVHLRFLLFSSAYLLLTISNFLKNNTVFSKLSRRVLVKKKNSYKLSA